MNDSTPTAPPRIAVCIPCFRVSRHILGVLAGIGPEVSRIFVVDDACPENSGGLVGQLCQDSRVQVLSNPVNIGVGGSVMRAYAAAMADGCEILVKMDGDGQMDPRLLPRLVRPIACHQADYTKGNRFHDLDGVARMPRLRVLGNSVLSLMAKLSTGYWGCFDPTNGYTAIHARVAALLPVDRISRRYFFETDVLFRLNTLRAVVVDIPMPAIYAGEASGLREWHVAGEFAAKHLLNTAKRVFYNYFLRDMSVASLELVLGALLVCFGALFGGMHWWEAVQTGVPTPLGTIMLAALPVLVGFQLLLAFLGFDIAAVPRRPVHEDLPDPGPTPPSST